MHLYTFVIYLMLFGLLMGLVSNWSVHMISSYLLMINKQAFLSSVQFVHDQLVHDIHEALPHRFNWHNIDSNQELHLVTHQASIIWKIKNGRLIRSVIIDNKTHSISILSKATDFVVQTATKNNIVQHIKVAYTIHDKTFYVNACPGVM